MHRLAPSFFHGDDDFLGKHRPQSVIVTWLIGDSRKGSEIGPGTPINCGFFFFSFTKAVTKSYYSSRTRTKTKKGRKKGRKEEVGHF